MLNISGGLRASGGFRIFVAEAPDNVVSGYYTVTVNGTHNCLSTVQQFVLDDSLGITAGRYVLLRASDINNYVGATVTPPTGLTVTKISKETVNYSGTNYKCIVVTLE